MTLYHPFLFSLCINELILSFQEKIVHGENGVVLWLTGGFDAVVLSHETFQKTIVKPSKSNNNEETRTYLCKPLRFVPFHMASPSCECRTLFHHYY